MFQEGISGENWKLEKCKNPALKYFLYFEKQNFSAPRKPADTGIQKKSLLLFQHFVMTDVQFACFLDINVYV